MSLIAGGFGWRPSPFGEQARNIHVMSSPLTAGDIMTRSVATTTKTTLLPAAIKLMLEGHVSGLPVLDSKGVIVGILTEGDLLRRVELGTNSHAPSWLDLFRSSTRVAREYVETHSRVVGDIMTQAVVTVSEAAPLSEVVSVMQGKHVKRVPVLADRLLVGMVSRVDLLRALADTFAETPEDTAPSDGTIRAGVLAAFSHQSWAPMEGISVSVTDGVVDLGGVILCEADRAAMRVAAQNVTGVTSVRDHLIWIEPNSGMMIGPDPVPAI
jgi:CBS domain-containing protein